METEH